MKKVALILSFATLYLFVTAQEKTKVREIGFTTSDIKNFGLSFKTGTEESLWRFSALSLKGSGSINVMSEAEDSENYFGFGGSVGKENRLEITDKLKFRYGLDLNFSYHNQKYLQDNSSNEIKNTRYSAGINTVTGLNYNLNKNLLLGVEILPWFSWFYLKNTNLGDNQDYKRENQGFSYGFSSDSFVLTLAYVF